MLRMGPPVAKQSVNNNDKIALKFLSKEILLSLMQDEPLYKIKKKTYNLLNLLNNIS